MVHTLCTLICESTPQLCIYIRLYMRIFISPLFLYFSHILFHTCFLIIWHPIGTNHRMSQFCDNIYAHTFFTICVSCLLSACVLFTCFTLFLSFTWSCTNLNLFSVMGPPHALLVHFSYLRVMCMTLLGRDIFNFRNFGLSPY